MADEQVLTPTESPPPQPSPSQPQPTPSPPTAPTTTEAKPPTSTPSTTDQSLLNKEAPKGAPEAYAPFKVPDGQELDAAVNEEVGKLFKGMNLSQAQAQSLVDFYVKQTTESFQQPFNAYQDIRKGWVEEAKNHPEIGKNLDQVIATVGRAIDGLGDAKLAQDFRQAMDFTGAGDNPAFIRVFYKLAQMVTEGTAVKGVGPAPTGQRNPAERPASAAHALYPNLT